MSDRPRATRRDSRLHPARLLTALGVAALALTGCREAPLPTEPTPGATSQDLAAAARPGDAADEWIVVFQPGTKDAPGLARKLAAENGGTVRFTYEHVLQGFAGHIPSQAVEGLRRNPNVLFLEADGRVTKSAVASWGLDRIDQRSLPLDGEFVPGGTGSGVDAWIIDTGIDYGRTDEFGTRLDEGRDYDFVDNDSDASDCDGHGTHVAGTVASATYGVAKGATIIGVRVLDCDGSGTYAGVIAGIDYVAANATGPTVANMSLGGGYSSSVNLAVANAVSAGLTMVVAAGNEGQDACNKSPASAPEAITVGATMSNDARSNHPGWWSSNYGSCLDLFAPGSAIVSTVMGSGTASWYGTSMASPHVAGAAALVLGANPGWSPAEVWAAIQGDATAGVVTDTRGSPNLLLHVGDGGGTPPPPGCEPDCPTADVQWVSPISVTTRNGGRSSGAVTVQIVDASGPLGGAVVNGSWILNGSQEIAVSGTTGADGTIEFKTGTLRNVDSWGFCVVTVSAAGLDDGSGGECSPFGSRWSGGGDPPPDGGGDPPSTLAVSTEQKGPNWRANLTWNGGGASVDVFRNNVRIATVSNAGSYTDNLGKNPPASAGYRVCDAGTSDCSGTVTVNF